MYIFLLLFLFTFSSVADAATYYVNNQGRDKNPGTQSKPWKTIARVNKQDLNAGDQVLFAGGQTFRGSLLLDARDSGTVALPLVVGSYGTGRAIIDSGDSAGLFGYNVTGVTVVNLNFLGSGSTNTESGVSFYTDAQQGAEGVTLGSLDVSHYGQHGVEIGSWGTTAGYRHIEVVGTRTHHNGVNGFLSYAQYLNVNQDVRLRQVGAFANMQHGIVLGGVAGGLVDSCEVYENGLSTDPRSGPVGVFAYDSTRITIQNTNSYRNHTAGTDGDGFDFGQNVSFSTMQYNASSENDGTGYLLDHGPSIGSNNGNIIQYNTSTNDVRKLSYGAIQTWGRVKNATIRNNTVILSPGVSSYVAALTLANWSVPSNCVENLTVSNNSFMTSGPKSVLVTPELLSCSTGIRFQNNTYQANPFSILWGSSTYNNLTSWTNATGQQ